MQIAGQARNHTRPPALTNLTVSNGTADVPVQVHQFRVRGDGGADLGCPYPLLDPLKQRGITSGNVGAG